MSDSVSSIASLSTQLRQQQIGQQVSFAVFNKAQDIQQQQGEAVLQLLESAQITATSVDVYA